jgi:hypothetical protein
MKETIAADLSRLGLTPTEVQVYLALLQNGAMGASAIAAAIGLARTAVYPTLGSLGELPHKLAIFDSQIVLMPLIRPGHQTKTFLIRHAQLAESLSLAFQFVWDRSEPVANAQQRKTAGRKSPIAIGGKHDRNHQPTRAPNR